MLYYTHLLFTGLLCSLLWESLPEKSWLFVGIALFSTLLPDIDKKNSILGRVVPLVGRVTKHRSAFHTPLAAAIGWAGLRLVGGPIIAMAFLTGYLSHLGLDAISKEGIIIFYPLSKKHFRGPVSVGRSSEYVLAFLIGLILIVTLLL